MSLVVTVYDGINARAREPALQLRLVSDRVTARELIERRVRQEVEAFNSSNEDVYRGLVKPTEAEETLNGFRFRLRKQVKLQEQVDAALSAFASNGFLLLIDDRQVSSLDEWTTLQRASHVTFIKLVPLVGG
jgi:hypothetical protein